MDLLDLTDRSPGNHPSKLTTCNPNHILTETLLMLDIPVKKGEPIDRALKRLKSKMEVEGKLDEVRRLRAHETKVEKSRRKARTAAKKNKYKFRFLSSAREAQHQQNALNAQQGN